MLNFIFTALAFLSLYTPLFGGFYPEKFEEDYKEFEANPMRLISFFLPDDPVIVEAGAHYGWDTIRFAKVWPDCSVFSFEPNPHAYEILKQNLHGSSNNLIYNLALNTYTGKTNLYLCHGPNGNKSAFEAASSILEPNEAIQNHCEGPVIEVFCINLDFWAEMMHVRYVDLLWLDLEGFELQILKSCPHVLKSVKAIYVKSYFQEFRKGMTQYDDLRNFLEDEGFDLVAHWYKEGLSGKALFIR